MRHRRTVFIGDSAQVRRGCHAPQRLNISRRATARGAEVRVSRLAAFVVQDYPRGGVHSAKSSPVSQPLCTGVNRVCRRNKALAVSHRAEVITVARMAAEVL